MRTSVRSGLLEQLVAEAILLSMRCVDEGGIPFAALVVDRRGKILGCGVNQVKEDHDPTAHAEVTAIRAACRLRQSAQLNGCLLIASGEPCALCYIAAIYASIGEVVFAADRAEAARSGFDYRSSYRLLNPDPAAWPIRRHHHPHPTSGEPSGVGGKETTIRPAHDRDAARLPWINCSYGERLRYCRGGGGADRQPCGAVRDRALLFAQR